MPRRGSITETGDLSAGSSVPLPQKEPFRRLRRGLHAHATALGLLAGAVGLGLVVYASSQSATWLWTLPAWDAGRLTMPDMPGPAAPPPEAGGPPQSETSFALFRWIVTAVVIVVLVVVVIVVARLVVRVIRALRDVRIVESPSTDRLGRGPEGVGVALTTTELTDAVAEALRRLDEAPTATDAVIAAWLAFEEAAARKGMGRNPAQTPTEFTADVLARSSAPADDLGLLRRLYWRARFSDLPTARTDVSQAREALEHVARALEPKKAECGRVDAGPASEGRGRS